MAVPEQADPSWSPSYATEDDEVKVAVMIHDPLAVLTSELQRPWPAFSRIRFNCKHLPTSPTTV